MRQHPAGRDSFGAGDIISVIKQIGPTLRPSEQRVAEAMLADVDFAVHSSNARTGAPRRRQRTDGDALQPRGRLRAACANSR